MLHCSFSSWCCCRGSFTAHVRSSVGKERRGRHTGTTAGVLFAPSKPHSDGLYQESPKESDPVQRNRDLNDTVRHSPSPPHPRGPFHPLTAQVPRILFFGGDVVSLAALRALHTRLRVILTHHLPPQPEEKGTNEATPHAGSVGSVPAPSCTRVETALRESLVVVCPSLPGGCAPEDVVGAFHRQFPVARYAAEAGLRVVAVDHPHSFAKSRLLGEMLACEGAGEGEGGVKTPPSAFHNHMSNPDPHPNLNPNPAPAPPPRTPGGAARTSVEASPYLNPHTSPSACHSSASRLTLSQGACHGRGLGWDARVGRPLSSFDLAVVVSFRYFLPLRLLRRLPAVINLHPSRLPHYRGASPVFATLQRNESLGGVSVLQLPADPHTAMDGGPLLWQADVPIAPTLDIRGYLPLVAELGAAALSEVMLGAADVLVASKPVSKAEVRKGEGEGGWKQPSRRHKREQAKWEEVNETEGARGAELKVQESYVKEGKRKGEQGLTTLMRDARKQSKNQVEQESRGAVGVVATAAAELIREALAAVTPPPRTAEAAFASAAKAFTASVQSSVCDWPDGFRRRLQAAQPQVYPAYASFHLDPFHAPRLPRSAAVLRFTEQSGLALFGVWRAFVGGLYFHPSVNAQLDRGATPASAQLLARTQRRLAREKRKTHVPLHNSATALSEKQPHPLQELEDGWGVEKACARAELRVSCAFTGALHPALVLDSVLAELRELEASPGRQSWFHCNGSTSNNPNNAHSRSQQPRPPTPAKQAGGSSEMGIPPGTGYFPKSAESIAAIKCAEGWFYWTEAQLKEAPSPQSASLLRKGLAIKRGVLYEGLFLEYK